MALQVLAVQSFHFSERASVKDGPPLDTLPGRQRQHRVVLQDQGRHKIPDPILRHDGPMAWIPYQTKLNQANTIGIGLDQALGAVDVTIHQT